MEHEPGRADSFLAQIRVPGRGWITVGTECATRAAAARIAAKAFAASQPDGPAPSQVRVIAAADVERGGRRVVYVTHVRLVGGPGNQHIVEVRWHNPSDGATGRSSRETMVAWIRAGGEVRVGHHGSSAQVEVIDTDPPHIQACADGTWTDALLALPRLDIEGT
jgi:hypothetical protein